MKKRNIILASGLALSVAVGVGIKKLPINVMNDSYIESHASSEIYVETGIEQQSEESNNIDGKVVWENKDKDYQYMKLVTVDDGIIVTSYSGNIVKYNFNGKIIWENNEKKYNYVGLTLVNDGVIALGNDSSPYLVKYDFNGDIIWEKNIKEDIIVNFSGITTVKDGIIVYGNLSNLSTKSSLLIKYDFDGNKVWKNTKGYRYYSNMTPVEDGVVVVSAKFDDGFDDPIVVKVDSNGKILWENTEKNYEYYGITTVEDGVIAVSLEGNVVKFNLDGKIVWENTEKNYRYSRITALKDGVIVTSIDGEVVKYDLNGNVVWENTDKDYHYNSVVAVKDGAIAVSIKGNVVKYGKSIDRGILDEIISQTTGLIESDYSDESWKKLQEALSGTEDLSSQSEIDAKVTEIQNALDNLDVDKSALNKLLEDVSKLTASDYSITTWQNLQNAVNGADALTKQSEIDAKVTEIQNAINNLDVDRSALDKLLEDVSKLTGTDYNTTTWQNLQNAVNGADALTKQSEIDAKVTEIQNAIDSLGVDKSALSKLLEDVSKLTASDYSTNTWQNLQNAVSGSDALTKQSEIDAKVTEIQNAIDSLGVDKSALSKLLEDVSKLTASDYSTNTWQNLQNAVSGSDALTKQSEIDAKVTEIQNAINNLDVDRSALDKLLEDVSKLTGTDYNTTTWQNLQNAVNGADALTKQSEIDAKVTEIQNAIDSLGVDKSALSKLLEDVSKLTASDYSVNTWQNLQNAVSGADALTKQSEIDAKVTEIQNALDNLDVDRSALDKLLEDVSKLTGTDYNTTTWQNLQNAVNGADALTKQSEVDAKVNEIQNAINNLSVDKSALSKLLEDVSKLTETDYSTTTWQNLQDVVNGADTLTKQSEIDAKVTEIQNAIDNLDVDRSALDKLLEDVSKLTSTDYSATSWQNLQDVVNGADTLTKQSEIDAKVTEIQNAIDNLDVDRSALDKLLKDVSKLTETDYSATSWQNLQSAVNGASALTKQSEINAKFTEIQNAIDSLDVDKSALNKLLEDVSKLTASDYSITTWQNLQNAVNGADTLTKQSEIDTKVSTIQNALDKLQLKDKDRSKLEDLLKQVEDLDEGDYTPESWKDLQDAITGADDLDKQSDIDNKVAEIEEAIKNLVVVEPDRSELDDLLKQVENLEEGDYSSDTWKDLQDAIIGTDNLEKQSEVDAKVKEIQDAIDNLGVDRSELDKLLEDVSKLEERDYSKESWKNLSDLVDNVEDLTKQSEINRRVDDIKKAIEDLTIDTSKLEEIVERVKTMDKENYTKDSLDNLMKVVDSVEEYTKQYEVDAKVEEIEDALSKLKLDPSKVQIKKGDMDRNGVITANDASIILDLYKNGNATPEDILIGDMDNSGTLTANDASMILDMYKNGK